MNYTNHPLRDLSLSLSESNFTFDKESIQAMLADPNLVLSLPQGIERWQSSILFDPLDEQFGPTFPPPSAWFDRTSPPPLEGLDTPSEIASIIIASAPSSPDLSPISIGEPLPTDGFQDLTGGLRAGFSNTFSSLSLPDGYFTYEVTHTPTLSPASMYSASYSPTFMDCSPLSPVHSPLLPSYDALPDVTTSPQSHSSSLASRSASPPSHISPAPSRHPSPGPSRPKGRSSIPKTRSSLSKGASGSKPKPKPKPKTRPALSSPPLTGPTSPAPSTSSGANQEFEPWTRPSRHAAIKAREKTWRCQMEENADLLAFSSKRLASKASGTRRAPAVQDEEDEEDEDEEMEDVSDDYESKGRSSGRKGVGKKQKGVQAFWCELCQEGFTRNSGGLKRHNDSIHSGPTKWYCYWCDHRYDARRKDALDRHYDLKHGWNLTSEDWANFYSDPEPEKKNRKKKC